MDEQAVISTAQSAGPASVDVLLRAQQDVAFNLAYWLLGDHAAAAEATREALTAAYRALPAFRGGSCRNWLLRLVTRACARRLPRQRRLAASSRQPRVVSDGLREGPAPAIEAGLAALPWEERVVLVLSDLQSLSYGEIAEITGASPGAVSSRLGRARASLGSYLAREGAAPPSLRPAGVGGPSAPRMARLCAGLQAAGPEPAQRSTAVVRAPTGGMAHARQPLWMGHAGAPQDPLACKGLPESTDRPRAAPRATSSHLQAPPASEPLLPEDTRCVRRSEQAEFGQHEDDVAASEAQQTKSAALPLLLALFVLLFSPFLYDLARWLQRLMG